MARPKVTYQKLINMAKDYGVSTNALFVSAANQYILQQEIIEKIKSGLDSDDELVIARTYGQGNENVYPSPLIKELTKHCDSANKTLQTMLDVITKLGHMPEPAQQKSLLSSLMSDD